MAYLFLVIVVTLWILVKKSSDGKEQGPSGVDFDGIPFDEKMKAGKK